MVGQAEDEVRVDAEDALGAIDGLEVRRVFSGWGFYRRGLLFGAAWEGQFRFRTRQGGRWIYEAVDQDMLSRPDELAEVHWAPSATWADLQDMLLDGEWHVLHFIGHGDFDHAQDEGMLALVRPDGRADLVAAHRLVDLLRQTRPMPRLVVLNSCSGGAAGVGDLFSGTAAALVRGGVSAVAAMQYEISDIAAVAFTRGFYAAIVHGRGVDDAVSSGRVAILGLSDRTLEWVTPVLYLRGHDSQLFAFPAPAEDSGLASGLDATGAGISSTAPRADALASSADGGTGHDIADAFGSLSGKRAGKSWCRARTWCSSNATRPSGRCCHWRCAVASPGSRWWTRATTTLSASRT